MSTWLWVVAGVAAFLLLSVAVALGLAAILGRISQEVSELLEPELWSSTPNARERSEAEQETSSDRRYELEREKAIRSRQRESIGG